MKGSGVDRRRQRDVAVLQVIAGLDPAYGGPPVCAVNTALALTGEGYPNAVAFTVQDGREEAGAELLAILRANGTRVHVFPEPRFFGSYGRRWAISPKLAAWLLLRSARFDVVHAHGAWTFPTIAALVSARLFGRVAVLAPHAALMDLDREKSGPFSRFVKRVLRSVLVRTFHVVVTASTLEQADIANGGKSKVVPHAVVGDSSVERRTPNAEELNVGFLGRLHPTKNVEVLIDALALLPDQVVLHVAGDGSAPYKSALASRAAARGVERRVRWLGFVDDRAKSRFFASIDVLAMPSAFEGFGIAAVEALIAGVPVVVSSGVGVADFIDRGKSGRVVAPTAGAVAGALEEMLDQPEARQRLSRNARIAAREFSVENHGARLAEVYEEVLRRRTNRARSVA